jgi:F-type H+-transporting ATPase subunit epsilon
MPNTFQLDIVTPQGAVFSGPIEHLRAPGVAGSFGVLPSHTPFMTSLDVGEVDVRQDGKDRALAISGGFIEVLPDHTVILAQTAEFAEDIDVDRATSARQRAEERLSAHQANLDENRAKAALARAANRLRIASRR